VDMLPAVNTFCGQIMIPVSLFCLIHYFLVTVHTAKCIKNSGKSIWCSENECMLCSCSHLQNYNWQQQQQHWLQFHEDRWESSYGGNIYSHFCTSVCDCCLGHVFNGVPCNCGIRYCTILCPHFWNFHSRWHLLPFLTMPLCGNCSHKCSSLSARFYKETSAINISVFWQAWVSKNTYPPLSHPVTPIHPTRPPQKYVHTWQGRSKWNWQ
jgi:hypothetical protein